MEYIRELRRKILKRNIFAVLFPTIKMFRYRRRRHGLRKDLRKALYFLRA